MVGLTAGCRSSSPTPPEPQPTAVDPRARTVAVVTTGCGHASATIGSGVALDRQLILTAAHVVIGSDQVSIVVENQLPASRLWPDFSPVRLFDHGTVGSVVALDRRRDLALVSVDPANLLPTALDGYQPKPTNADSSQRVLIHGVTSTAVIEGSVAERTVIVADEVGGSNRVRRLGYRLAAETVDGDSGAGVWLPDGRLAGVLFAVSTEDESRSWAVAGSEVASFLEDAERDQPDSDYRCDADSSRLTTTAARG